MTLRFMIDNFTIFFLLKNAGSTLLIKPYSPFGARWSEFVSWKQFVADKVSKISQRSNDTANITGYISYSFRVICRYGNLVRDENTYQDNECIECLRERSSAEQSWRYCNN